MASRFGQALLRLLAGLLVTAAIGGAAWLGVAAAKRTLPEGSNPESSSPAATSGERRILATGEEPIYLAGDIQSLRDFYFAHPNAASRRDADVEARGIRRVPEEIDVELLETDGDAVEIKVLAEPFAGTRGWIHLQQWNAGTSPALENPSPSPATE